MANSMLDAITQFVTPSLASRIGAMDGESQSAVSKGFAATIPAILGMVTSRANDSGFLSQLLALAKDPSSSTLADDPSRLMDQVTSPIRTGGLVDRFRSLVIGASPARLVDTIASYAGVQSSTASSILGASIPMVLAYLGRLVQHEGLDAAGLGQRLAAENQSTLASVPAAFSGLLSGAPSFATTAARSWDTAVAPPVRRSSAWSWITAAIAVAAAWAAFNAINRHRAMEVAERAVGTAGEYATLVLPSGVSLRVPSAGSEAKLFAALTSAAPVSSDTWFEFDRLAFESGSANLTADSRAELSGIAAILKAYPAARLRIGGFTDNAGDPITNLKLSQDRATSVKSELVGMGISPDRLEAEGYGEKNPIATNDTEEGRSQNRRVSFSVTEH